LKRKIRLNGEICEVEANLSVAEFLNLRGFDAKTVVVLKDDEIVKRADFSRVKMDGEKYEIIHFVGGG